MGEKRTPDRSDRRGAHPAARNWTSPRTGRLRVSLAWKDHANDQLTDRGLIMGDLHYLLRNGFVYEPAEEATRKPFWNALTPNSKSREVRAVASLTEPFN